MAVVLYNTPASGRVMSHDLINRIADIETVIGIKEGLINWGDSMRLRRIVGDKIVVSEPIETYWLFDHAFGGGKYLWATLELPSMAKSDISLGKYQISRECKYQEAFELYKTISCSSSFTGNLLSGPYPQKGVYIHCWTKILV
jgi:4-hydroxy-tetrahydrodipicolinate synthase